VVINSSVLPKCHYLMGNQFIGDLFLNIVSNAVKFDTAKRVKVDIGITEDRSAKGDYWLISIVDRGRGIPDDRKKAVFERFATGMTGIKGFGLGLSIVSTIVEKFGGRIWVEDRIQGDFSKGAVFKVLLPKARPPPEPLPALSLPMAPVAVPGNNGVKP
jgi:signal transduction histidine kinase